MSISIITPPDVTKPPITIELLKSHLSILQDEIDFDEILQMYLGSAVDEFTAVTKRCIINTTVRQTFDDFPCEDYFRLERAPLVSFTSLQYRDTAGAWQTVDSSIYSYDVLEDYPILQLKEGKTWPSSLSEGFSCVRLQYVAGYGADETTVPYDIKRILCMLIGDSYLHREESVTMPGVGLVVVNASAARAMKKYMLNYYEHASQKRR